MTIYANNSKFHQVSFCFSDVVKKIASTIGLEKIANKRESMGICFVGKRKDGFSSFLEEYIQPCPGPFVDIETYKVVGEHTGIHNYTLGQRTKIKGQENRRFVVDKDVNSNTVYVCEWTDHPSLYSENFFTGDAHWIDEAPDELTNRSKDQVSIPYLFLNT